MVEVVGRALRVGGVTKREERAQKAEGQDES